MTAEGVVGGAACVGLADVIGIGAGLGPGRWRPVKGVLRWFPGVRPQTVPRRKVDIHDFIACPTCGARADQRCRTTTGNSSANHQARVIGVRCRCGQPVTPYKQYCEPCRILARTATFRRREIRNRTSERRAS